MWTLTCKGTQTDSIRHRLSHSHTYGVRRTHMHTDTHTQRDEELSPSNIPSVQTKISFSSSRVSTLITVSFDNKLSAYRCHFGKF